jgi:hypothetical protein
MGSVYFVIFLITSPRLASCSPEGGQGYLQPDSLHIPHQDCHLSSLCRLGHQVEISQEGRGSIWVAGAWSLLWWRLLLLMLMLRGSGGLGCLASGAVLVLWLSGLLVVLIWLVHGGRGDGRLNCSPGMWGGDVG